MLTQHGGQVDRLRCRYVCMYCVESVYTIDSLVPKHSLSLDLPAFILMLHAKIKTGGLEAWIRGYTIDAVLKVCMCERMIVYMC